MNASPLLCRDLSREFRSILAQAPWQTKSIYWPCRYVLLRAGAWYCSLEPTALATRILPPGLPND